MKQNNLVRTKRGEVGSTLIYFSGKREAEHLSSADLRSLSLLVTLMPIRIRILLVTLIRIRLLLVILIRILINFTLKQILILASK